MVIFILFQDSTRIFIKVLSFIIIFKEGLSKSLDAQDRGLTCHSPALTSKSATIKGLYHCVLLKTKQNSILLYSSHYWNQWKMYSYYKACQKKWVLSRYFTKKKKKINAIKAVLHASVIAHKSLPFVQWLLCQKKLYMRSFSTLAKGIAFHLVICKETSGSWTHELILGILPDGDSLGLNHFTGTCFQTKQTEGQKDQDMGNKRERTHHFCILCIVVSPTCLLSFVTSHLNLS